MWLHDFECGMCIETFPGSFHCPFTVYCSRWIYAVHEKKHTAQNFEMFTVFEQCKRIEPQCFGAANDKHEMAMRENHKESPYLPTDEINKWTWCEQTIFQSKDHPCKCRLQFNCYFFFFLFLSILRIIALSRSHSGHLKHIFRILIALWFY